MDLLSISAAIVAHAEAHYEQDGWDVIVECYSPKDLAEHFEHCNVTIEEDAWETARTMISVYSDRLADARNSVF